ncbi:hypothetical protein [Roseixanthobacter pseudopolyaromaticivorans]|uniref:hypothetical protein n=1 Tax=Xanthobacteraceae TaxID=335928 RepID=UPI00372799FB
MFDIKEVEKQARAEIAKERGDKAKARLKDKLKQIAAAERIVQNLKNEYEVLLLEIGDDA